MAIDSGGYWIFVFKAPADDFKWLHIARIGSTSDPDTALKYAKSGLNPDVEIVAYEPMGSHERLIDVTAEVASKQGPDYRPLKGGEEKLTKEAVAKLKGKALIEGVKPTMTIEEAMSRAHAMALTEPRPE